MFTQSAHSVRQALMAYKGLVQQAETAAVPHGKRLMAYISAGVFVA
jgi:hypothetical protein